MLCTRAPTHVTKTYIDNTSGRTQQQGMCDRSCALLVNLVLELPIAERADDRLHSPAGCTSGTVIAYICRFTDVGPFMQTDGFREAASLARGHAFSQAVLLFFHRSYLKVFVLTQLVRAFNGLLACGRRMLFSHAAPSGPPTEIQRLMMRRCFTCCSFPFRF